MLPSKKHLSIILDLLLSYTLSLKKPVVHKKSAKVSTNLYEHLNIVHLTIQKILA